MFWKKDKGVATTAEAKEPQKAKKVTAKDQMIEQINLVEPGKEIVYRLAEIYVKPFITVVRNAQGKRFTVLQEGPDEEGNPSGLRGKLWDVNDAKGIASWVIEREGIYFKG